MKTSIQKMLTNRMLLGLALALAFSALLGLLRSAEAKVVVRASVVTPVVEIHATNAPSTTPILRGGCVVPPAPGVVVVGERKSRGRGRELRNHRGVVRKLRQEDRRIARRLQHLTGIDRSLMLSYRRAGWTWPEIAFELRIRRAFLADAMNASGHVHRGRNLETCTYQFHRR